jgi:hypothetical protein
VDVVLAAALSLMMHMRLLFCWLAAIVTMGSFLFIRFWEKKNQKKVVHLSLEYSKTGLFLKMQKNLGKQFCSLLFTK